MEIWVIVFFLLAGYLLGFSRFTGKRVASFFALFSGAALLLLLAAMGARIGSDSALLDQLHVMGIQAFYISLSAVAGSVLLLKVPGFFMRWNWEEESEDSNSSGNTDTRGWTFSLVIFLLFAAGMAAGVFLLSPGLIETLEQVINVALGFLLLGIGVGLGKERLLREGLKKYGWRVLLIPLLVAAGSIAGASLCGFFLDLTCKETAAVGAGFGWYSLSGVLLTGLHSAELGALAFLANILRELMAILTLPLVVKTLGNLVGIAPGGATTMDVTLPLIEKVAGREFVLPAFINGVVLSLLVPLLVPLIAGL